MNLYVNRTSNPYKTLALTLILAVALLSPAHPAFATESVHTLGDMTSSVYNSILTLQTFLSLLSYTLGIFFTVTGLKQLRDHVTDPGNNPLQQAIFRLGASAFFIFAPFMANVLITTIGGSNQLIDYQNTAGNSSGATTGPEAGLVHFVQDFADPFLSYLLPFFAWAAGMFLMLIGLKRMAQASFEGPRDPTWIGTGGTFFVAACLMSLGYIMYTFNFSLFGNGETVFSNPLVKTGNGIDADIAGRVNQVMWGVFIFLRIVGYLSVVRGLFMLRGAAEGQNVSMMAIGTHLFAGAMLANATAFVLIVQETFVPDANDWVLQE